jgi:hypothetical protein
MNRFTPTIHSVSLAISSANAPQLGGIALASLMDGNNLRGTAPAVVTNPMAPKLPHFRREPGTSSTCSWPAHQPVGIVRLQTKLIELNGQPIPQSFIEGKRFAFMDSSHGEALGTRREFKQYGQSARGYRMFPHTASIADDITIAHSCAASCPPAKLMNTGSGRLAGRAWARGSLTASEASQDLPLRRAPVRPARAASGAVNWGSGFLPTSYQAWLREMASDRTWPIPMASAPCASDNY